MEKQAFGPVAQLIALVALPVLVAAKGCDGSEPQHSLLTQGGAGGATTTSTYTGSGGPGCAPLGGGGAELLGCDYVTVDFSATVPVVGLAIVVDTSEGDHIELAPPDPFANDVPTVRLVLSSDETQALGFHITRGARLPHFAPEWLHVVVRLEDAVVGDGIIMPTYSCVALSGDDRCLRGAPQTLSVTPP